MTDKQFFLEYTSSNFQGKGCVPLDEGRWVCRKGENDTWIWVFDASFNEFELSDAMYDISGVDGDNEESPHYCAVLDALSPILQRQETNLSFVVDNIFYTFQVTC